MSAKVTQSNGEYVVTGNVSLFEALRAITQTLDKASDRQLKLAKIARDEGHRADQAGAEVRAESLIEKTKLYLTACENLPPSKRTRVEKMECIIPVEVTGGSSDDK